MNQTNKEKFETTYPFNAVNKSFSGTETTHTTSELLRDGRLQPYHCQLEGKRRALVLPHPARRHRALRPARRPQNCAPRAEQGSPRRNRALAHRALSEGQRPSEPRFLSGRR